MTCPWDIDDAAAMRLYETQWEDPGNHEWPDPKIAEEVRAMLRAATDEDAHRVIEWWGDGLDCAEQRARVHRLRVLGGVEGGVDVVARLRATGLPVALDAAEEIERLRGAP